MTTERRTATRHAAFAAAEIEVDGAVIACGITRNASISGVQVLTHRAFLAGTPVTILVYLPVENALAIASGLADDRSSPRRLLGTIVRTTGVDPDDSNLWSVALSVALDAPCPDLDTHLESLAQSQMAIAGPPISRQRPRT
jgi:hypothetical protein